MFLDLNTGKNPKNYEDGYYFEMLINMLLFPEFALTLVSFLHSFSQCRISILHYCLRDELTAESRESRK